MLLSFAMLVPPFDASAATCDAPSFADYPIHEAPHRQTGVQPMLTDRKARMFQTVIRTEFAQPANFAGHYRVAIWGCGTDCRDFAILDQNTGHVYTMPGVSEIDGVMGSDDERIDFRLNSRLFVISACFNGDPSCLKQPRKQFYEWTGRTLKWLRRCPMEVDGVK
ncbi:hypothetical protein D7S86_28845 [Pararobbsia silviterrae]|uniref:DUF3757 domain-containing protein n=2 Tax=Pararobbsia silviterrae TaxID=1792498 RepID=A0A494X1H4_9BURK|nr:hypothetical protein D7S86_28845 [Pararobbsia silviterrae]